MADLLPRLDSVDEEALLSGGRVRAAKRSRDGEEEEGDEGAPVGGGGGGAAAAERRNSADAVRAARQRFLERKARG